MIKKILFSIIFGVFVLSCSSLTAQERFERGDYIGSLQKTAEQMRNKKSKESETREQILHRVKTIENMYKNAIYVAKDDYYRSIAYFNMWQYVDVINKNPELRPFANVDFSRNYDNLKNSVDYALRYVSFSPRERVKHIANFVKILKERNVKNTEYGSLYELLARRSSDIYVDIALNYEYNRDLENAMENYYNAYTIYSDFSNNYKNSRAKYEQLMREVKLQNAEKIFDEARSYYERGSYSKALDIFRRAYREFEYLSEYGRMRDIKVYMEALNFKIQSEKFETIYNNAWKEYTNAENTRDSRSKINYYKKAIALFKESLKYSSNNAKFYEIQEIIDTINSKISYYSQMRY